MGWVNQPADDQEHVSSPRRLQAPSSNLPTSLCRTNSGANLKGKLPLTKCSSAFVDNVAEPDWALPDYIIYPPQKKQSKRCTQHKPHKGTQPSHMQALGLTFKPPPPPPHAATCCPLLPLPATLYKTLPNNTQNYAVKAHIRAFASPGTQCA